MIELDAAEDDIQRRQAPGYIYLIQCGGPRGPIKIGHAANTADRVSTLQMGCPYPLELIAEYRDEDCAATEAMLHRHFAGSRIRGEWFESTPDLEAFATLIAKVQRDWFVNAMTGPQ